MPAATFSEGQGADEIGSEPRRVERDRATAGVADQVHRLRSNLLDESRHVEGVLVKAELVIAAPRLRIAVTQADRDGPVMLPNGSICGEKYR